MRPFWPHPAPGTQRAAPRRGGRGLRSPPTEKQVLNFGRLIRLARREEPRGKRAKRLGERREKSWTKRGAATPAPPFDSQGQTTLLRKRRLTVLSWRRVFDVVSFYQVHAAVCVRCSQSFDGVALHGHPGGLEGRLH